MTAELTVKAHVELKRRQAECNRMLPLIRVIMTEIRQLTVEINQTRDRLSRVTDSRYLDSANDVYSREVQSMEESLTPLQDRRNECYDELTEFGVLRTSFMGEGFVDFLVDGESTLEGRVLCWHLSEPAVIRSHVAGEPCQWRDKFNDGVNDSPTRLAITHKAAERN